jgi:hypothetical protein
VKESEETIKQLEMKIKGLEHQIEHLEDIHSSYLDENDVRVLVERILIDKEFATKKEIESIVNESQLQLVKWIIGTGISVATVIASIIQFI